MLQKLFFLNGCGSGGREVLKGVTFADQAHPKVGRRMFLDVGRRPQLRSEVHAAIASADALAEC